MALIRALVMTAACLAFGYASAAASDNDFNRDGKPDILLRHQNNGAMHLFRMNGLSVAADEAIGGVDPAWNLVGTGDFNGDGDNDLVWRHSLTGATYVWFLNNGSYASDAMIFLVDPLWKVEAVADFDKDGKPDFLFRNGLTGLGFIWYFNGVTPGSSQFLYTIDNSWIVESVGNLKEVNKLDFLFRNTNTGLGFAWRWDRNKQQLESNRWLFTIDNSWKAVQIDDWDGDGKGDIVFQSAQTGVTFVWYTDGDRLKQNSDFLFAVDPVWSVVPSR